FDDVGRELVVCDNNSTDRTAGIARAAGAKVVFEPHNQISRARNRGASAASGEWLVFIDADSTPGRGLFEELREAIDGGGALGGGSEIAADSRALSARRAAFLERPQPYDALGGRRFRLLRGGRVPGGRRLQRRALRLGGAGPVPAHQAHGEGARQG